MHIILAILLVNAFVLALCGLIAVAGRFLRQSGKVRVVVNGNDQQDADCGQKLFTTLAGCNVYLPAACGGKGTCGRCLVKVMGGGGPVTPMEKILLTSEQLVEMARLACQVKIRENIRVELPAELLSAKGFRAKLLSSVHAAEDIKTLNFALEDGQGLEFLPGQYLQVFHRLPWETAIRAYSISSPAHQKTCFSLDVQRVDEGLVSNFLHQLQPQQVVEFSGPFGEMALRESHREMPVILVAGGVGVAPMRSIVSQLRAWGFLKPVMFFHGARSRVNLVAEDYFRELEHTCKNFSYFPALSNPMLEEGWVGQRGMIHLVIERILPEAAGAVCFVCGPAPMMQSVTKVLVAKGAASDRIFTDPFDF
ncbi:MAG: 2Fe-2S iron-sulfur cluster binding domain-containing protein [Erysipelotrichia bacterium]|nr:2Fe-2S iron-sulfur cluster binding domain-containing protein [Erysipelotrichia bacterium]